MNKGPGGDSARLLQVKHQVPRQRIDLVERAHLVGVLDALSSARLTLLIAPAGYGKTTLLGQWCDNAVETGKLVAWITLEEEDGDPRQFLSGAILALDQAGIELGGLVAQAEQGLADISMWASLDLVVEALQLDRRPCFVVLDDYHRAQTPTVDALLGKMVHMLPANARLILSARTRPQINVPKLLASGVASELSADALRLTAAESRQVLDTSLTEADFDTVFERTEGWPVALQLARLMLHGEPDVPRSIRQLTSRGSHLSTYLADQVLGNLSSDVVDFLMETSILERFDAALTDAVRERSDSWQFMDRLEPLQSLMTPIEDGGTWYRYHHLFADYLRNILGQRRPFDVARLHGRASLAFEAKGLLVEAVRHAAGAGDFARCAGLIEAAGGWRMVLYAGKSRLAAALRQIPEQERRHQPRVLAAEAYLKLKDGDLPGARIAFELIPLELRCQQPDWAAPSDEEQDIFHVGVLLEIYEDNQVDAVFLERLEQTRVQVPRTDSLTRGMLEAIEAMGALVIGRLEQAEALAQCNIASMRQAGSVLGLNYALMHAGLSSLLRGRFGDAEAYLAQARTMSEENFGDDSGLLSIADILWATMELWRTGNIGMSDAAFARALIHACDFDGWSDIYIVGMDTRFRMLLMGGDLAAARQAIDEGLEVVRGRGIERLRLLVQSHRLLLALARGAGPEASTIAADLEDWLPIGCWRTDPRLWRPYQECGHALVQFHSGRSDPDALRRTNDLLDCAEAADARIFSVRATLVRASLHERSKRRKEALIDLRRAIDLAAPDHITLPFLELSGMLPMMRALKAELREDRCSPVVEVFLSDLINVLANETDDEVVGDLALLSPREREVVRELQSGSTNKEIARALDMTEHTVKFHLSNVFAKLGVDRRAHVLAKLSRDAKHQ